MRPRSRRSQARRRRRALILVAVAAVAPPAWASDDLPLRIAVVATAFVVVLVALHDRFATVDPDERYLDMLSVACAIRVELDHVRIATVHRNHERAMVTVTWRGARTTLLDADARELATAPRNGLTTAYTMTLAVDDHAAALLSHERQLGDVSVYAMADLATHPRGNLREHGVTVEQYDVAFATWSGNLPTHRIPQPWDH